MSLFSQDPGPTVPIHNWMRLAGMVVLLLASLLLDVRDYVAYVIGSFCMTEGVVKWHGFMKRLPIGDAYTGNLEDIPKNQKVRIGTVVLGSISIGAGVLLIVDFALKLGVFAKIN